MTRTVDDVIREYEAIFADRLRHEAPGPRDACDDELLVAEIKRLRNQIQMMQTNCIGHCDTTILPGEKLEGETNDPYR